MPDIRLFKGNEEYYSTLFHELAHSTGHKSRLNREELIKHDRFGGENYSKEEGWLKALQYDKTLVIKAACQAQKAADYKLYHLVRLKISTNIIGPLDSIAAVKLRWVTPTDVKV